MPNVEEMPTRDAFVAPLSRTHALEGKLPNLCLTPEAIRWLGSVALLVEQAPSRQVFAAQADADAAVALTPLNISNVTAGLWRISTAVRVTTPGTVSSAVQVTITWTEGGITQTDVGTNLNGNLTTTREGRTIVLRTDAGTPISYSTTYSTAGATAMLYSLDVVAEELASDG